MALHVIENELLRVEISDHGAELSGVLDKRGGTQRLWNADPAVWNRHAPILFPFVGKVQDGVYRVGGREYPMKTQHGFARDREFTCLEATERSVCHCLCSDPETEAIYPYPFRLLARHRLEGETLSVEWTVENTGTERMYYAIGGHPGFLPPPGAGKEDCFLGFPDCGKPEYFSVSPAGYAIPGKRFALSPEGGFVPYDASIPNTWIFDGGQVRSVLLTGPDRKPWVTLDCPGFPFLAVWANPKGPFICLEPWYGRTDDEGFAGEIPEKPGEQCLDPGEARSCRYDIHFHA